MNYKYLFMVGRKQIHLKKHLSTNEMEELLKEYKYYHRIYLRLLFIRMLYKGEKLDRVCEFFNISVPTGYNWLNAYNEQGFEGLKPKFAGGRPSKLTSQEFLKLKEILNNKIDAGEKLSIKDVHRLIIEEFKVDYSLKRIGEIIRELGFNYNKAYPFLYKTT